MPVYNERDSLATIVERVLAVALPGLRKELVIVDDASTDGTAEILRELALRHPEIRAFEQPKNQGKGGAVRRAIREMSGDFAIIQDADLEYDPNDYPKLLGPLLDGLADVVYGSRFAPWFAPLFPPRESRRVGSRVHRSGNMFLTILSNMMTGLDLTDMETCYKAFRADLLKTIPIRSNRFGIEPELTAKCARRKAVIFEVPIDYAPRGYAEGKKIGWKDGLSAIWTILKYRFIDDSEGPIEPIKKEP